MAKYVIGKQSFNALPLKYTLLPNISVSICAKLVETYPIDLQGKGRWLKPNLCHIS